LAIEGSQQIRPGGEVVIDDGLGHIRALRKPTQGQRVRALFPHQLPGDLDQLAIALRTRHPPTHPRETALLSRIGDGHHNVPNVAYDSYIPRVYICRSIS